MIMNKTIVSIPENPIIDYHSPVLFMGSCFSEHLSDKMMQSGFSIQKNPFGVVFNPISLAQFFRFTDQEIMDSVFSRADVALSWLTNSSCFAYTEAELKTNLTLQRREFIHSVSQAKVMFVTLGTAWVYQKKNTDYTVGNCHKVPKDNFEKRLLSVGEITAKWTAVIDELRRKNKDLDIIFTVSPVRHTKDGAMENARSKAILLEAVHQLKDQNHCVDYFPAYELMMDEMRDYAYYSKDGVHPNDIAIDEIWKRFQATYFMKETQDICTEFTALRQLLQHRSIHPDSSASKQFVKDREMKWEDFKQQYPFVMADF
jgi:lysophospholipase L1-like esterase